MTWHALCDIYWIIILKPKIILKFIFGLERKSICSCFGHGVEAIGAPLLSSLEISGISQEPWCNSCTVPDIWMMPAKDKSMGGFVPIGFSSTNHALSRTQPTCCSIWLTLAELQEKRAAGICPPHPASNVVPTLSALAALVSWLEFHCHGSSNRMHSLAPHL